METSAPKRRRTSPQTSVPVYNNEATAAATRDANESTTPPRARTQRQSFASPTKSTLSRTNPDIFERRQSSQRERAAAAAARVSEGARRDNTNTTTSAGSAGGSTAASISEKGKQSSLRDVLTQAAQSARARTRTGDAPVNPASELGQDAAQGSLDTYSRGPARRIGGSMGSMPRRSPIKPVPRPFPQPDDAEPDIEINPFAGRVLNRTPPVESRTRGVEAGDAAEESTAGSLASVPAPTTEPELPPTPTQQGKDDPVVTSPAQGIHDTPSKRARRRSSKGLKSSPLKARPLRPVDFDEPIRQPSKDAKAPTKATTAAATRPRNLSDAIIVPDNDDDNDDNDSVDVDDVERGPHPARGITAEDAHVEKKACRDRLKAELVQIKSDLAFATEENERIRQVRNRRRSARQHNPQESGSADPDRLLDILRRCLLPVDTRPAAQDVAQQLLDAALNPNLWFGASFSTGVPLLSLQSQKDEQELPTPKSHHPISMTAQEQLPFIQAFTPFHFTSHTVMLPRDESGDSENPAPPLRQHDITISTAAPSPGLFASKVRMTVNTDTLRIADLAVPRLEPAAIAELGPFIKGVCADARQRNVTVMCWAMAEWYRIAVERAHFWAHLAEQVADGERFAETVRDIRATKKRRGKRQANRSENGGGDDDDSQSGEDLQSTSNNTKHGGKNGSVSAATVLQYMGRTAFEVPIPQDGDGDETHWPSVRIQWKIDFDWTGEGQSRVGVLVGVPGKWHEATEKNDLIPGVQRVFSDLIRGRQNIRAAVHTVIALLATESTAA